VQVTAGQQQEAESRIFNNVAYLCAQNYFKKKDIEKVIHICARKNKVDILKLLIYISYHAAYLFAVDTRASLVVY